MRRLGVVVAVLCAFLLTACADSGSGEPGPADEEFLQDLVAGWVARWGFLASPDQQLALDDPEYATKSKKQLTDAIALEVDHIGGYASLTFEDADLRSRALDYIGLLDESNDALQFLNVDVVRYNDLWTDIYDRRTIAILDFIDTYSLEIPPEHQGVVDEMRTNAALAVELAAFEATISEIVCNLEWEAKESYGWYDYEAPATNTTGTDLDHLSLTLTILDRDGVNVDSSYASISNWRAGQTALLEFTVEDKVADLDVAVDWSTADGQYGNLSQPCAGS